MCVQEIEQGGHKIVIFSNQASIKSTLNGKGAAKLKAKVDNILDAAGVKAAVLVATMKDENRKPELGMWKHFTENCNGGKVINKEESFFVGDAAGGKYDFADTDKEFARKIGLPFKTPEEFFGPGMRSTHS
jgi:bifunctional polynucleotide phosphatase/kinase